ncbi:MAG: redoxin domain-containing protein [Chloroflexi bacterium]|nr:redoxin domain-containing protein [Chloroflexota bacterium]
MLLAARMVLALVFAVAGLAKLADRAGSQRALRDFGLPGLLASTVGVLLPLGELGIAVALLPAVSAWWAAVAAVALLLLFVVGMSVSLLRGRRPSCHCFGQLHSAPVGGPTLVRNLVLAIVAGGVVFSGAAGFGVGPSALGWIGGLAPGELAVLLGGLLVLGLLALEAWLLVQLVAQNGRLLVKLDALEARLDTGAPVPAAVPPAPPALGLPVGSVAPDFSLPGLYGETLTLGALRATGQPVLLVFMDPDCGPCNALLPEVGRWQREQARQLTVAVISRGTVEANRPKSVEHGISRVLLQQDREVAEQYQVYGTPSAVLVHPDGRIGNLLGAGAEAIRALVASALGSPAEAGAVPVPVVPNGAPSANGKCPHCGQDHGAAAPAPALSAGAEVGTPAPALQLPGLDGKTVDLAQFHGQRMLVLFWNPGCGFCQQMLPDLKLCEASPPPRAPKLLVISTGTAEANRAQGIKSPVLLDPNFSVGLRFGVNGTPSALLVDAEGRIASAVGVGAPGVWPLLGGAPSPPNGQAHTVPAPRA